MYYAFFVFMLLIGAGGYITINNVGDMVQSFNDGVADTQFTFWCVSLLSLNNGIGRLIAGISDHLPIKRGYFCILSASFMLCAYLWGVFFVKEKDDLFGSVILVGLGYGSMYAILPTLAAEHWGRKSFAICWGWISLAPSLGSLVFNAIIAAMYDAVADANHICIGAHCWQHAFFLAIGAAAIGLIIGIAITPYTIVGKHKQAK